MRSIALGLGTAVVFCGTSVFGSVITFNTGHTDNQQASDKQFGGDGDNISSASQGGFTYGSAGGWTPDVTIQFNSAQQINQSGYGDLSWVVTGGNQGGRNNTITLDAASGYEVSLQAFDLAALTSLGDDYTLDSLKISAWDGSAFVAFKTYTGDDLTVSHSTHTAYALDDLFSERIQLSFGFSSGTPRRNVAIDNLQIAQQAVPEPAMMSLLAIGGCLGLRRRTRKAMP